MKLDRTEARILGSLTEKRWTTPDQYPLTLNALVASCNQKSNRLPTLNLEEFEITGCLLGLRQRGLVFVVERAGSRVQRYDGQLGEKLGVERPEEAILAELLLRGPQTPPELFRRCARMAHLENPERIFALLRGLAQRQFVREMPRQSGQRHARWTQLLCTDAAPAPAIEDVAVAEAERSPPVAVPSAAEPSMPDAQQVPAAPPLRDQVSELRSELDALRRRVAALEERRND